MICPVVSLSVASFADVSLHVRVSRMRRVVEFKMKYFKLSFSINRSVPEEGDTAFPLGQEVVSFSRYPPCAGTQFLTSTLMFVTVPDARIKQHYLKVLRPKVSCHPDFCEIVYPILQNKNKVCAKRIFNRVRTGWAHHAASVFSTSQLHLIKNLSFCTRNTRCQHSRAYS